MSLEKLSKLVLMLSSPSDGEVVAAARAIDRTLPALGLDWHSLAAMVHRPVPAPPAPTPNPWQGNNSTYATPEDFARLDAVFNNHMEALNAKERGFIKQLVTASRVYGRDKVFMTTKQRIWLHSIHGKVTE